MRLDRLWIDQYKNLRDITIDFDEDEWVTVLIGWNGTGKSNVIEALSIIFRDLIFTSKKQKAKFSPPFSYRLYYECSGHDICIHADSSLQGAKSVAIRTCLEGLVAWEFDSSDLERGELVRLSKMSEESSPFCPQFIFGYYSGESSRLSDVFWDYIEDFDKQLRAGKDPGLKRLFYAQPEHSNYVLLSFILQQDEETVNEFLIRQLGLDPDSGIDSVLFVMNQPSWKSKEGDPRFWNARGIVSEFLGRLYDASLAPIRISREVSSSLWNKKKREFLYLYVKDLASLRELAQQQEPRQFFRDLESTHVSELIDEVRIRIRLKKNDGKVTFRELSEGEQQLLTVLGLLRFTKERESLFLLDEPDTHLNPRWAVDYIYYLRRFVDAAESEDEHSHIVLATHNPLAIAELHKKQVRILRRNEENLHVEAFEPEESPRGMGYAGIVTSDMFGINTSLDKSTYELLERQRAFAAFDTLTKEQNQELHDINQKLDRLGFRFQHPDEEYSRYLRLRSQAIAAQYDESDPEKLSQSSSEMNREEKEELARRLITEMISEEEGQA